jgi:hypothetical protein
MAPHPPLHTIIDNEMADHAAEQTLARDIVAVHGPEAAVIARQNARAAALAGQPMQAKSWIRVLGTIQRQQKLETSEKNGAEDPHRPWLVPGVGTSF